MLAYADASLRENCGACAVVLEDGSIKLAVYFGLGITTLEAIAVDMAIGMGAGEVVTDSKKVCRPTTSSQIKGLPAPLQPIVSRRREFIQTGGKIIWAPRCSEFGAILAHQVAFTATAQLTKTQ
jgi:hypothetical protein